MIHILKRIAITLSALVLVCVSGVRADVTRHRLTGQTNVSGDLGVDTATVKTQTALFANPDTASAKIGILHQSDLTVLVSREKWNGWYRIIQYSSGHQGWVLASKLFEPEYTKHRRPGSTLSNISTGTTDPPTMNIKNDLDVDLYLHIDKLAEVSISPHTVKSLTVQAGIFSFNAAAPNLLPDFGHMAFLNGTIYSWSFFIPSAHDSKKQSVVTPQMVADYNTKLADVNAKQAEIKIEKQQIDDARDNLHKQGDKAKAEADDIDARRIALDRTDEKAVDAFNLLVISANNDLNIYNKMKDDFNNRVDAYNSFLDALDAEKQQLASLERAVNAPR